MEQAKGSWRRHLEPIDLITAAYLGASGVMAVSWAPRLQEAPWLAPAFLGGAVLVLVLPPLLRRSARPWALFFSDWYPLLSFTFFYKSTALLNRASPIPPLDPWLADLDIALFGGAFCERFTAAFPSPAFGEVMAFSYFSYYGIIPGVSLYLWIRNRRLFHTFLFCAASGFYVFYLIFNLFPSAGPQYFLFGGFISWEGIFFAHLLTELLQAVESPTGAFPSSHVGVALICTVFIWRQKSSAGVLLACLTLGLAAATLYGGPHYFIDLPSGLILGIVFLLLSGPVQRGIKSRIEKK